MIFLLHSDNNVCFESKGGASHSMTKIITEVLEKCGSSKTELKGDLCLFGWKNGRGRKSLVALPLLF